jgi:uncharacterized DUF497 family protein
VDIVSTLEGIGFTWNRRKALANIRQHGVVFETAAEVFLDPFLQVVEIQEENDEEREVVIGMTIAWQILFCVSVYAPTVR